MKAIRCNPANTMFCNLIDSAAIVESLTMLATNGSLAQIDNDGRFWAIP